MTVTVLGGVNYFFTVFCGLRINIKVSNKPEIGYFLLDSSRILNFLEIARYTKNVIVLFQEESLILLLILG